MAAIKARCLSASVALLAATAKTVIQIAAPANQRVKLSRLGISFDGGTSTSVPARVRILRQTTAGTFTSATNAPVPLESELTETVQTNYQVGATAEPTAGALLDDFAVPTFDGQYLDYPPFANEIIIQGGGRLGVEVTAPAAVNVRVTVEIEE